MKLTQLKRTANQREAGQSSWVELCRYKRALTKPRKHVGVVGHTYHNWVDGPRSICHKQNCQTVKTPNSEIRSINLTHWATKTPQNDITITLANV